MNERNNRFIFCYWLEKIVQITNEHFIILSDSLLFLRALLWILTNEINIYIKSNLNVIIRSICDVFLNSWTNHIFFKKLKIQCKKIRLKTLFMIFFIFDLPVVSVFFDVSSSIDKINLFCKVWKQLYANTYIVISLCVIFHTSHIPLLSTFFQHGFLRFDYFLFRFNGKHCLIINCSSFIL